MPMLLCVYTVMLCVTVSNEDGGWGGIVINRFDSVACTYHSPVLLRWYLLQTVSIMCEYSTICYLCIRVDLLFLGLI